MAAIAAVFEEERKIHFTPLFQARDSGRNFSEDGNYIVLHEWKVAFESLQMGVEYSRHE